MTLQRALAMIGGLIVAVVALSVSIVAVALLAVVGSLVFGYYWWKTRDLRRELKARMASAQAAREAGAEPVLDGVVIEGEWQRQGESSPTTVLLPADHTSRDAVSPAPTFANDAPGAPDSGAGPR
jgi:hypothetical protein